MSNLGLMSSRAKDNFWAPSSDMAAQRAPDLTPRHPAPPLLSRYAAKVPILCSLAEMNMPRQLPGSGTLRTRQTVCFSSPQLGQPYYWGKEDRMARPSSLDSGGPFLGRPCRRT